MKRKKAKRPQYRGRCGQYEDKRTGLTVVEPNMVYFNNYLRVYIGASWAEIKTELYAQGYKTRQVNEYREEKIREFEDLCDKYGFNSII